MRRRRSFAIKDVHIDWSRSVYGRTQDIVRGPRRDLVVFRQRKRGNICSSRRAQRHLVAVHLRGISSRVFRVQRRARVCARARSRGSQCVTECGSRRPAECSVHARISERLVSEGLCCVSRLRSTGNVLQDLKFQSELRSSHKHSRPPAALKAETRSRWPLLVLLTTRNGMTTIDRKPERLRPLKQGAEPF